MCEEIKRNWDEGEIAAVQAWYVSTKGFHQIESAGPLPTTCGMRMQSQHCVWP